MPFHALWLAATLLSCVRPPDAASPTPRRMQLFLLVGQSNMAGRGTVSAQDRIPHPRVWMLDSAGRWTPAVEPVHFDKAVAGVGPGRSFALALAEREPSVVIGLVPAAVGGSAITAWEPGVADAATRTRPYDDAIRRARLAKQRGDLRGILWHQGESDSNERGAPAYAARLTALVARFRADLEAPDVPVVVGQLGRFPERPWTTWREQVNAAHVALPGRARHTAYVSAEGLGHRGDSLHFDAPAARELGRRYAAAYLAIRDAMARR